MLTYFYCFFFFFFFFFFFNDTATTEIYTLSLHDALPIFFTILRLVVPRTMLSSTTTTRLPVSVALIGFSFSRTPRSEEHTSELQSQSNLVCRLLLEKKKKKKNKHNQTKKETNNDLQKPVQ